MFYLLRLSFIILLSLSFIKSYSQSIPAELLYLDSKRDFLDDFSKKTSEDYKLNITKALELAVDKGWEVFQVFDDGTIVSLQGVDISGFPIYYTTHNVNAATTIGTNKLWPGGALNLNLSASSNFLHGRLGMWDGGRVRLTHQEFMGRVVAVDNSSSISSHATHVAGTLIAAGINPDAIGMSFNSQILKSWDFSNDVSEMASASSDLLVSNHSYGVIAGWRYNSSRAGTLEDPNWEWWGDPNISTYEDFKFGYYNSKASDWDIISYNSPYYLIVNSAGNNRNSNGPDIGMPYWTRTSTGSWQLVSERVEGAVSSNDSYGILSTYANAKNILLVGAVSTIPDGYSNPDDVLMSDFSSWGPTDDGRIKPDVVADGINLLSAGNTNTTYRTASGTSMSAPNASGSIFLLQELYYQQHGVYMLASTLRGLICHTANDAGNPGPDYSFGWGLVNMEGAANVISNINASNHVEEILLNNGEEITRDFVATGIDEMKVTISWTDPPGTPISYGPDMLNNRTPMLVNDLDLRVSDGETIFMPWVLDVENPSENATTGDNLVDNIEQVLIENTEPGKTYTVTISHKGELANSNQVFSLIVSGAGGVAACPSYALDDNNSRIDGFEFNTISNRTDDGCHSYRDFSNMVTSVNIGSTYSFSVDVGTCNEETDRIVKIYVDWNSDGFFNEDELVAVSEIISTSGAFDGEISVPGWLTPGQHGRIRIVLVETDNADDIAGCGLYGAGETQDYMLAFNHPKIDLGIEQIIYPNGDSHCPVDSKWIELMVRNYGLEPIESFKINAYIIVDNNVVHTVAKEFEHTVLPFSTSIIQINTNYKTEPNQAYNILCVIDLNEDDNPYNDTIETSFTTLPLESITYSNVSMCFGDTTLTVQAKSDGVNFWYDSQFGDLVGVGDSLKMPILPDGNNYFVNVNDLNNTIGPESKNSSPWTGGTYTQAIVNKKITAHVPIVIKSAKLYIGWPGRVNFWIEDSNGNTISNKTLYVDATRNPASIILGAPDDPSDEGEEYFLNLQIPEPGEYFLKVSYVDGVTLFRNNSSSSNPYPYEIAGVVEIESPNENAYYWLYDIKVTSLGCRGERLETPTIVNPIPIVDILSSQISDTIIALDAGNSDNAFYWSTGETTQSIQVHESGIYSVWVTNQYGCVASDSVEVEIDPLTPFYPISIFPNPVSNLLNVVSERKVFVELFNLRGSLVNRCYTLANHHKLDVSNLPASFYFVKIFSVDRSFSRTFKIIVIKDK